MMGYGDDVTGQQTEQYDSPVLLPLTPKNTRGEAPSRSGRQPGCGIGSKLIDQTVELINLTFQTCELT